MKEFLREIWNRIMKETWDIIISPLPHSNNDCGVLPHNDCGVSFETLNTAASNSVAFVDSSSWT